MEIGLFFQYVSDENRVKASSPKQLEVRVTTACASTASFEVVFVREREILFSVQTGCLVYLYVTGCFYRTEIPLRFS